MRWGFLTCQVLDPETSSCLMRKPHLIQELYDILDIDNSSSILVFPFIGISFCTKSVKLLSFSFCIELSLKSLPTFIVTVSFTNLENFYSIYNWFLEIWLQYGTASIPARSWAVRYSNLPTSFKLYTFAYISKMSHSIILILKLKEFIMPFKGTKVSN